MNKATIAAANYDAQWGADTATDASWHAFRIPGLEHISGDEFRMKVKPLIINFPAIEELLITAGIPRTRAYQYVEQFSNDLHIGELAHALAERMERIG
jgi:hypothetical protein